MKQETYSVTTLKHTASLVCVASINVCLPVSSHTVVAMHSRFLFPVPGVASYSASVHSRNSMHCEFLTADEDFAVNEVFGQTVCGMHVPSLTWPMSRSNGE